MLLLAIPPPWVFHLSDERFLPPASLRTAPLGLDYPLSTHLAMAQSTKYTGPGSPSSHLQKERRGTKEKQQPMEKGKRGVWPRVPEPATVWLVVSPDEAHHRVVWW